MKINILVTFFALVLLSSVSKASDETGDFTVFVGGFSHHIASTEDFNEIHNTVGFGYNGLELILFKNSYSNTSIAFNYHMQKPVYDWLELGLRIGGVYGYNEDEMMTVGGIAPIIQPTATLRFNGFGVEFGFLPAITETTKGVATLMFSYKF